MLIISMTTSEKIRHYRKSKGLTQLELAELVGYDCSASVCNVEKGRSRISSKRLIAIAKALDVAVAELKGVDFVKPLVISDDMTTGQRIRAHRESQRLTRLDLGGLLGYKSYNAISKIEHGQCGVSPEKLASISKALSVSVEELKGVDFVEPLLSFDGMTTGQKIRAHRESNHLTQIELAKLVGYKSDTTIRTIERSRCGVSPRKLANISNALNVSVEELKGVDLVEPLLIFDGMTTGQRIRAYRESQRLTQIELAKLVGYNSTIILSLIENGKRNLPLERFPTFAEALNVSIEELKGVDFNEAFIKTSLLPSYDSMTTGQRIRFYRQRKGLMQCELAELVGYKGNAIISRIEKGKYGFSPDKLTAFAEVLGVADEELKGVDFNEVFIETHLLPSCDSMTTGQRIRFYRQRKGLMQRELAELVGYKGVSAISQIESGQYGVSFKRLAAISNALNVSVEELKGVDFNEVFIKTSLPPSYDSMTTGQRIRFYRQRKGLTQCELAELVGYKTNAIISDIEKGKCGFSPDKLTAFAEVLGVADEELKGVDFNEAFIKTSLLPSYDSMTTGQRIRFYRQRKGLMQRELAELVGYKGDSAISQIESGQYGVSFKRLANISNALNVSVEELKGVDFNEAFIKTPLLSSYDSMTTG